ncbi:hypothetical protein [Streptomyces sp. HB132]|uniref:hypothetical protein n=1 Tax=Streptomyces sp. HB132 TaxID=767388 RepID=UPI001960022E|nr:hypothetical protein [Streptomyces sp. HB132]MBM7437095.1 hypothetical protein [Streptomyces sp. HB132]
MPAPEREVHPQSQAESPSASAVSMKDLLASCAAATAVSTPPRGEHTGEREPDRDDDDLGTAEGRDAA